MLIWIFAVLIGILAGFLTPFSWFLLGKINQSMIDFYHTFQNPGILAAFFLPSMAALFLFLLFFITRAFRSADGFTYFISDIHFHDGQRKIRYSFVHGIAAFFLLLGGGVIGLEALCFEALSAFGGRLGIYAKLPPKQVRALAGCGLTAGLAALLGEPMAAFLFAIELLYGWGSMSFTVGPFAISAFVAASLGQTFTSPTGIFRELLGTDGGLAQALSGDTLYQGAISSIVCIFSVGICTALIAAFVIWLYRKTDKELHALFGTRRATDVSPQAFALRLLMWTVMTGTVFFYFPEALGTGIQLLHSSLSEGFLLKITTLAIVLRILMGVLGYTVFGTMGIVLPTLVIGALVGSGLASAFSPFIQGNPSMIALLGMGAFFSASFGTPVTATALVYGYAGGLASENALFLFTSLITNFIAHVICGFLQEDRMASMGLYRHGIRFRSGMCFNTLSSIQVRDAMLSWVTPLSKEASIGEAYKTLMSSRFLKLPVVDTEGKYCGVLSLNDFYGLEAWRRLGESSEVHNLLGISELIKQSSQKVKVNMSLEDALRLMSDEELVSVVEEDNNKFAGILLKSDLVNLYNKEVVKKAFRR